MDCVEEKLRTKLVSGRGRRVGRFWDRLTGKPSIEIAVTSESSLDAEQQHAFDRSAALNKKATQKKKAGDWTGAIECVREADRELVQAGLKDERVGSERLAILLHGAGRRDEAWGEFNKMIQGVSYSTTAVVVPMFLSEIYDKMRLCLQREGRHAEAVGLRFLAYCYRCNGFQLQQRFNELKGFRTDEFFGEWMLPHLKKANAVSKLPELQSLARRILNPLPAANLSRILRESARILKT